MLKIHTNLSLRKTWLNTLAGVARGQRSFAYEKTLYLIGLKYAISFLFWSKIENSHKIIARKNMVKLYAGVQGGKAPLPKKNVLFDKYKIHNLISFLVTINNKNNHNNGKFFFFVSIFFQTSFQRPPEVAPGARAPLALPLLRHCENICTIALINICFLHNTASLARILDVHFWPLNQLWLMKVSLMQ